MHIVITGAAGMIGRKLVDRLVETRSIGGRQIERIDLVDIAEAPTPSPLCHAHLGDLSDETVAHAIAAENPDVVFHLAGVVSGEAEANFDKGMRVNLDGTKNLFDALRETSTTPRVIFSSSIAVFGAPFPDPIPDDFHLTPLTSYGMQKMIGEALLGDYSRRGFFDGIGIRLPTISVRPGAPNAAASGFFSGIIREPLTGQIADLPVERSVRHSHASPRTAVGYLVHAAELDTSRLGPHRNLTMPGVSVTVEEQIEALARVAGAEVAAMVIDKPDPVIAQIVHGWPQRFDTARAHGLGFRADADYDAIIQAFIEDDLRA